MVVIERKVKPKLNGIRKTFRNAKVGKSNQKKKKKMPRHKFTQKERETQKKQEWKK